MKKFYKLSEGKKIGGVCNGIADMYNFDVTLVRLAFIFVTVITQFFPGIITYLAAWYLLPEKDELINKEVKN
ncbi:MAG: PspC domain-containing protein [Chitinispirillaceae bacterium]|nr:PspC domain-containing protein [Chitinispirillaceae bacterium]